MFDNQALNVLTTTAVAPPVVHRPFEGDNVSFAPVPVGVIVTLRCRPMRRGDGQDDVRSSSPTHRYADAVSTITRSPSSFIAWLLQESAQALR